MNILKTQTKTLGGRRLPSIALALSSAAAIGLLVGINAAPASHAETPPPVPLTAAPWAGYADLVETIMPSVVTVTTSTRQRADLIDERPESFGGFGKPGMGEEEMKRFTERFFHGPGGDGSPGMPPGMPRPQGGGPMIGAGSGFIVEPDGLIATNNHVIANADEVTVTLNDGREFDAEIVGADPATDLALLKVETDEPLPGLADSASQAWAKRR